MSWRAVDAAYKAAVGNPTAKAILVAYAYHANPTTGEAWPSNETLQAETDLGERAIREWKQWLVDQTYLIPAGRKHKSPVYRINFALLEERKAAPGAGFEESEEQKPAPRAGLDDGKPAPRAGLGESEDQKPAPGAGLEESKPARGAGEEGKPAPGAAKPAPGAPKPIRTSINLTSREEEEEAPAAPAEKGWILTAPEAERVFTDVTLMVTIPGGIEEKSLAINAICSMAAIHGPALADYLKPFYQAWTLTTTKQGQPYQRTNLGWLTEWAVGETIPAYALAQLRLKKPGDLPKELAAWMMAKARADSKPAGSTYSADTAKAAESLGLVPGKGKTK